MVIPIKPLGVFILDSSAVMRKKISGLLEGLSGILLLGTGRSEQETIEKLERLLPDVLIMDAGLWGTGLETVLEGGRICILLAGAEEWNTAAAAAQAAGRRMLVLPKLQGEGEEDSGLQLVRLLADLAGSADPTDRLQPLPAPKPNLEAMEEQRTGGRRPFDLLLIGCSTGGPAALQTILPQFPPNTPVPILIVQHMPEGFTNYLADRFNQMCAMHVKEAEDGEALEAGVIYIAPAGFQTRLYAHPVTKAYMLRVAADEEQRLYKPSVDVALLSAAPLFRKRLLTAILTGMGNDGLKGCTEARREGGTVIVEAEESCVVYGMPRVVQEAGLAHLQLPLEQVYGELYKLVMDR